MLITCQDSGIKLCVHQILVSNSFTQQLREVVLVVEIPYSSISVSSDTGWASLLKKSNLETKYWPLGGSSKLHMGLMTPYRKHDVEHLQTLPGFLPTGGLQGNLLTNLHLRSSCSIQDKIII
jgi:hypothetical protein